MTAVYSSRTLEGARDRDRETDRRRQTDSGRFWVRHRRESESSRVSVRDRGRRSTERRAEGGGARYGFGEATPTPTPAPGPELWLPGAFCAHPGRPGAGKGLLRRLHSLWAAACTWAEPAAGPSVRGGLAVPTGKWTSEEASSTWKLRFCPIAGLAGERR